jgi:hypothetical protein
MNLSSRSEGLVQSTDAMAHATRVFTPVRLLRSHMYCGAALVAAHRPFDQRCVIKSVATMSFDGHLTGLEQGLGVPPWEREVTQEAAEPGLLEPRASVGDFRDFAAVGGGPWRPQLRWWRWATTPRRPGCRSPLRRQLAPAGVVAGHSATTKTCAIYIGVGAVAPATVDGEPKCA